MFKGLSQGSIRFLFAVQPVNEPDTPAWLAMEDKDTTDVFQCGREVSTEKRTCYCKYYTLVPDYYNPSFSTVSLSPFIYYK